MSKVLVVATSRLTRGGVTSVVKAHECGEQWSKFHCVWIQTHRDRSFICKLYYFIISFIEYIFLLPFYDIVHIHIAVTPSAIRKFFYFEAARLLRKKTILHFHPSNDTFLDNPKVGRLYHHLFSKADLVLVLSQFWKDCLNKKLHITNNVKVLYNPCPKVNRDYSKKKNIILFAGSIIERKGYSDLITAFSNIHKRYPNWRLVLAGNGEIDKAQKYAADLGVESKVDFPGWVSGNDKEALFNESSVYCLASNGEGFPMGILDAWAYGLPCVVTPVGGIPDIISNGKNGLIFPVNDIQTLTEKLELIIGDKDLRESIVKESDKYVNNEFNIDNINNQLGEIYSTL